VGIDVCSLVAVAASLLQAPAPAAPAAPAAIAAAAAVAIAVAVVTVAVVVMMNVHSCEKSPYHHPLVAAVARHRLSLLTDAVGWYMWLSLGSAAGLGGAVAVGAEEKAAAVAVKKGTLHYLHQYCSSNSVSCRNGHQLCVCVCVCVCVRMYMYACVSTCLYTCVYMWIN
jgi:hypothetical protein